MKIPVSDRLCPYLGARTGRQTLLALHGLGGSAAQLLALLRPSVLDRYDVIIPDLRAHGANIMPMDENLLTFKSLADDVSFLVEHLEIAEPPVLLGISMGAGIAVELQRDHANFAQVVLLRPAWGWFRNPPNLSVFLTISDLLGRYNNVEAREKFRNSSQFARVSDISDKAALALLNQFDEPRAVERRNRLSRIPSDAPTRPVKTAPMLVLGTDRDPVHPLAIAERLGNDLSARVELIANRYDDPEGHTGDLATKLLSL